MITVSEDIPSPSQLPPQAHAGSHRLGTAQQAQQTLTTVQVKGSSKGHSTVDADTMRGAFDSRRCDKTPEAISQAGFCQTRSSSIFSASQVSFFFKLVWFLWEEQQTALPKPPRLNAICVVRSWLSRV